MRVKFNNSHYADFTAELKSKVNSYFETKNISTFANGEMVFKTIIMISLYIIPFALILTNRLAEWQMLVCCLVMGIGTAGIGFAVQHDANHGAYSKHEWINKTLGFTLSLVGGSDYMWRIKHNILHHTYTNIHGKDEDISVVQFLRLSPNAPLKPIHRFQHYFAWILYSMLTLFWVLWSDYPKLKRYNGFGSPNADVKHPLHEVILLFAMKAFYFFYSIAIPILILDVAWWKILIGFTVLHLVAGWLITVVFQLAHVVEETDHPHPQADGLVDNSWFVHQLQTTSDFAVNNKLVTWYVGGLNFQVEHHLFPKICSIHYPAISKIVAETTKKYNVPYYHESGLREAVYSHYKALKAFGTSK
ncbi:MAG: fatty acid desaturase family protein [Cytophagales bacterium]